MKRTIEVRAGGVTITAKLDSRGMPLTRDEVEAVRDELADRLQSAAAELQWAFRVPRNRVVVR